MFLPYLTFIQQPQKLLHIYIYRRSVELFAPHPCLEVLRKPTYKDIETKSPRNA